MNLGVSAALVSTHHADLRRQAGQHRRAIARTAPAPARRDAELAPKIQQKPGLVLGKAGPCLITRTGMANAR